MYILTLNQLKAPAVGRPVNRYYTDHSHKAEIDLCEFTAVTLPVLPRVKNYPQSRHLLCLTQGKSLAARWRCLQIGRWYFATPVVTRISSGKRA